MQNGWGCKGPLEVICSNTLLKKGHLEPAAHDHVQVAFVCFQGWTPCHLPGQPVTVLGYPHRKKCISWCWERASCVSICISLSSYLSLHPLFRYFYTLMGFHLSLVFSSLNDLDCLITPVPQSSWPLAELCAVALCLSLAVESPELDVVLQVWAHTCWVERKGHWMVALLLMEDSMAGALLAARACSWLVFSSVSSRNSHPLLKAAFQLQGPHMYWCCMGWCLLRCRAWHFSCWIAWGSWQPIFQVLWVEAQPSGVLPASAGFCVVCRLVFYLKAFRPSWSGWYRAWQTKTSVLFGASPC